MNLVFFMHKDSIQGLYQNQDGIYIVKNDTIDIRKFLSDDKVYEKNGEHIKTYLLYRPEMFQKGIITTLSFCEDRLVQINMYTNRSYYVSNFEIEADRYFKATSGGSNTKQDSVVHTWPYGSQCIDSYVAGYGNKMNYQLYENLVKGSGYLMICDSGVNKRTPFFCLNCNGSRTWSKLNTYIKKRALKVEKQYQRLGYNYM